MTRPISEMSDREVLQAHQVLNATKCLGPEDKCRKLALKDEAARRGILPRCAGGDQNFRLPEADIHHLADHQEPLPAGDLTFDQIAEDSIQAVG